MSDIDLYSTHLEPMSKIFSIIDTPENVVEFGMGNYSTEFLIKNSKKVLSIEMQSSEWYQNMVSKFSTNDNWSFIESIGPFGFYDLSYPEKIDLSFVDGHGDSRPECINFMVSKGCPNIISHDTEGWGYGWNRVNAPGYHKIDFKDYENWTSLWTNDFELYTKLTNMINNV